MSVPLSSMGAFTDQPAIGFITLRPMLRAGAVRSRPGNP
jgi:hypothetical protein